MSATSASYEELCKLGHEAATLGSVSALVNWDQETYMPPGGAEARAEQSSLLAGLLHERATSPKLGELIGECEGDSALTSDDVAAANLREFRRDYDLATKLPGDLVRELAKVGSQSQEVWKKARKASDFAMFAPWLEKMMSLTRRKAECYGVPAGGELYDALINEYEPGATAKEIEAIFTPLRDRLAAFIHEVAEKGTPPDTSAIEASIPPAKQHEFGLFVLKHLGFDLTRGRLDTTTHPFCSGFGPGDTRLTTRYGDERFTDSLYGTMHEGGHGIYEQGLPKGTHFGQPLAESISLGIHESQSRMWENFVGRGRPFWTWVMPHAQKILGGSFAGASVDAVVKAVNTCQPSFIRVDADEGTYNLHVMLRFEIERALIRGDLKPADLPGVWNAKIKEFFGLEVPNDAQGCLQDVHWSFGLIGYFPTYCLGNLYAAQWWETINEQIPDLDAQMAKGEFGALKTWLNENIHAHGRRYRASELCSLVTGKPLSADPLMRHLESRIRPAYGI
jgi:carboxypeptidase Taq